MRNLILPMAAILVALTFVAAATSTAEAQDACMIVVTGNGMTAEAAMADAYKKAEPYEPYQVLYMELTAIPGGWICRLTIAMIG